MSKNLVSKSKFLSLVLRHEPERIGIQLDEGGWVMVEELLAACQAHQVELTREQLDEVVHTNDKKRFAFSEDGRRIRASQGHSVEVELGYEPQIPPPVLYHGTATRFLAAIMAEGLHKRDRQHVHLSATVGVAEKVGQRHGKPVVLQVDAAALHAAGIPFFLSANQVWLVEHVPARFLKQLSAE